MIFDMFTIQILAIFLIATLTSSTFGFGLGLIAMPLLALFTDIKTASALVAIVGLTLSIGVIFNNWRDIQFKNAGKLIISSLIGVPIGLYLLKGTQNDIMKVILALIILSFSVYKLFTPTLPSLRTDRSSYFFGFLAGIFGGAYYMGGPPVIIYASMRAWPPNIFRATLITFFFPMSVFILVGHFMAGNMSRQVLSLYALCIPIIILSIFLGGKFNRSIPKGKFDRLIYILLVFIGSILLIESVSNMIMAA